MNRFSASEAALEGFRLTKERPGTILAWSGIYAVGMLVIGEVMLSSLGADALAIARKGQFSPEDAQVLATRLIQSLPAFLLVLLLAVVLISVITGGIYRLVLRPEQPGFLHLRLGADELRLTLVNVALFAIGLVCLMIGFVAIAVAEQGGSAVGFVVAPLVAVLTVWVGVRLSLATPMAFKERHISLLAAWELTRGRFWPIFGMIVLSLIFYIMVWVLVTVIWFAVLMLAGGPEAVSQGGTPVALIAGVAAFVIQMLVSVVQLVMIYAPFAVAYQQLHGDQPANPLRMRTEHG
jgi:hypothetical protein